MSRFVRLLPIILFVFAASLPGTAWGLSTANELLRACEAENDLCYEIVATTIIAHDTMMVLQRATPMFCVPSGSAATDGPQALVRFGRDHPPNNKANAVQFLMIALANEFPCPKMSGRVTQ